MVAERIKGSDRGGSRGARCEINVAKQKQSKKTNKDTKKNENEHAQIVATRWFAQQKKQARNEPKESPKKATAR